MEKKKRKGKNSFSSAPLNIRTPPACFGAHLPPIRSRLRLFLALALYFQETDAI